MHKAFILRLAALPQGSKATGKMSMYAHSLPLTCPTGRIPIFTHKDCPLPAALPPKAAHNLGEVLELLLSLRLQRRPLGGTLFRDLRDKLEDFFSLCITSMSLTDLIVSER